MHLILPVFSFASFILFLFTYAKFIHIVVIYTIVLIELPPLSLRLEVEDS
ncbi:hypothetical protein BAWI5_21295 [Bacillus wiedmannii]